MHRHCRASVRREEICRISRPCQPTRQIPLSPSEMKKTTHQRHLASDQRQKRTRLASDVLEAARIAVQEQIPVLWVRQIQNRCTQSACEQLAREVARGACVVGGGTELMKLITEGTVSQT